MKITQLYLAKRSAYYQTIALRIPSADRSQLAQRLLAARELRGAYRRQAESEFIREARGFVMEIARYYLRDDLEREDVLATADAALWQAALDWDEKRGVYFRHFAMWRIRGALAKMLRGSRLVRGKRPKHFVGLESIEH